MSLINQALRKAQRDRTPNRMAEPAAREPSAPAAATGMKPGLVVGLVVLVALLLGLVVGLSVVLIKGDGTATTTQQIAKSPEILPTQDEAASKPEPPVAKESLKPKTLSAQSSQESKALERETTPPVVEELRKAREATEAKVAAEAKADEAKAKAEEEAAAKAAADPSQEIIDWLSRAQINGVKLSATESKVILNGESYGIGEYVNYALGLKVMIIQEGRILFVDANGKKYMKRL